MKILKIEKNEEAEEYVKMKEQDRISEKELNKIEISNLPEKEFKIMIIKMITELERRKGETDDHSENFSKELENDDSV